MKRDVKNYYLLGFYLIVFLAFGLIGYLMPLLGDDYSWAGNFGQRYFQQGIFLYYDGRYLGDLLVILITRFPVIAFFAYGTCAVIIIAIISKLTCSFQIHKNKGTNLFNYLFIASIVAVMLLVLPSKIFRQIWGWHAGFANYAPSVIFPLLFVLMVVQASFQPQFNWANTWMRKITLLLVALGSQFFAEHLTLLNCINEVFVFIFFRKLLSSRFLQYDLKWLSIGSFLGAGLMFINRAYLKIIFGMDSYRHINGQGLTLIPWFKLMIRQPKLGVMVLILITIVGGLIFANLSRQRNHILTLTTFLLLFDAIVAILPFIVISPFGPRCFFASYLMLMTLFLINLAPWLNFKFNVLSIFSLALFVFLGVHFDIMSDHYGEDFKMSLRYTEYQNQLNRADFYILNFKNVKYIWTNNLSTCKPYREFFVKRPNVKIITVDYHDWDLYREDLHRMHYREFDQKIVNLIHKK